MRKYFPKVGVSASLRAVCASDNMGDGRFALTDPERKLRLDAAAKKYSPSRSPRFRPVGRGERGLNHRQR